MSDDFNDPNTLVAWFVHRDGFFRLELGSKSNGPGVESDINWSAGAQRTPTWSVSWAHGATAAEAIRNWCSRAHIEPGAKS